MPTSECSLNTNLFLGCVKLTGFYISAVNVVSSNPCVAPSPRIKISLSYYQYAQMSPHQLQK